MKYFLLFLIYLPAVQFIPGLLILLKAKPMMDNMVKLNTGGFIKRHIRFAGLTKISCITLFFIPATMHIGFFLLCSWYGGAMMVHLASGEHPGFAAMFLLSIWISAYLTDPALFTGFMHRP